MHWGNLIWFKREKLSTRLQVNRFSQLSVQEEIWEMQQVTLISSQFSGSRLTQMCHLIGRIITSTKRYLSTFWSLMQMKTL